MSRVFTKFPLAPIGRWTTLHFFVCVQKFTTSATPARRLLFSVSSVSSAPLRQLIAATKTPVSVPSPCARCNSTSQKVREGAEKVKEKTQSLGDRLKKLSKEYGWVALGVYLGLSALDFPFCFLLVRVVGTERIGHLEHVVISAVTKVIPDSIKTRYNEYKQKEAKKKAPENAGNETEEEKKNAGASLGTQLALAYAIHKSLIFIRLPLTAAVLPKVVRTLRGWGYSIGKKSGVN